MLPSVIGGPGGRLWLRPITSSALAANCAKDERRENLRPQLPAAQQDKTAGRAEQPHHTLRYQQERCGSIYRKIGQPMAAYRYPPYSIIRVGYHFLEKPILLSNWAGGLRLAIFLKNMASNKELHRKPVSVVIADDHPVVLQGITEILRAQPDISVVAACKGGRDATAAIQQFTPDVAVLDIIMPDLSGLDVLLSIVGDRFKTRVVLLTAVATDDRILAAMTSGARAFYSRMRHRTIWSIASARSPTASYVSLTTS